MTPAVLRALADEVEQLPEKEGTIDRRHADLEGRVWAALRPEAVRALMNWSPLKCPAIFAPEYTSSLDDAASVMPPDLSCRIQPMGDGTTKAVAVDQDGYEREISTAATEVLARLACGLRARAATMEREQETTR